MSETSSPYALQAEATGLATRLVGPDPVAAVGLAEHEFRIPEPTAPGPPETEPDPDAGQPFAVDPGRLQGFLATRLPEAAAQLGPEGTGYAAATLAAMPREVVALADAEGVFGSPLSWHLLAQIERNAVRSGPVAASELILEPDDLAQHARSLGLPADVETTANISLLMRALPPRILAGISPEMARSPDLWALASHLGGKLWSFELRRPVTQRR